MKYKVRTRTKLLNVVGQGRALCFYADELSGFCLRRTVDTDINKITENLYVWLGVETPIKSRSL